MLELNIQALFPPNKNTFWCAQNGCKYLSKASKSQPAISQATIVSLNFERYSDGGHVERCALLTMSIKKSNERMRRGQTLHHRIEKARVTKVV